MHLDEKLPNYFRGLFAVTIVNTSNY